MFMRTPRILRCPFSSQWWNVAPLQGERHGFAVP
ncbi:hypothetical protein ACZ87_02090, partial [Candidatus Erwinia dacicola]